MQTAKRKGKVAVQRGLNKAKKMDLNGLWSVLKVILIGGVIVGTVVLVLKTFKGFTDKISAFFGFGEGAIPGQSGFDSTAVGSLINGVTGNTSGTSGGGGSTGTSNGTTNENKPWRPIVDQIWEKLNGANAFMYPEVVNKIAHLTDNQIVSASYYFWITYGKSQNLTLYKFIKSEWGSCDWLSGYYCPALNALKRVGKGE